tara:strand:- start:2305 stop:3042 length:738 start_codon:yes stop_codon:yes gene_type:complete
MMSIGLAETNQLLIDEINENNLDQINNNYTFFASSRDSLFETVSAGNFINVLTNQLRGNVYHVTNSTNLIECRFFLSPIQEEQILRFFVYDDFSDIFLLDYFYTVPQQEGGWFSSGSINIILEEGRDYIIGTGWSGTSGFWGQSNSEADILSFGERVGYSGSNSFDGIPSNNVGGYPYYQTLVTNSDDNSASGDLNGDGEVNIYDIITLINLVFDGEYNESGDVNGDGILNIADCVLLVDLILDN